MRNKWKEKDKTLGEKAFDMQMGKIMPHDLEAEKSLLGSFLVYHNSILSVSTLLKPTDFYSEVYRTIFESIITVFERGDKIDALNIITQLRKNGELEFIGGAKRVISLSIGDVTSETIKTAMYVIELAKKRELIALTTNTTIRAYEDTTDVFDLVSKVQKGIVEILSIKMSKSTKFSDIAQKTYEEIVNKKEGALPGIQSKFRNINTLTGGYRRGTLRTVAGRPGMGKSIHLVNESMHIAAMGYYVAIFSLEMPANEIITRQMSISTQIETWKLDKNTMSNEELLVLQKFVETSVNTKIDIDDSGNVDYLYLLTQIKKIKLKNQIRDKDCTGLDIVFIDYLQLMKLDNENRNIGLGEITRQLKSLSKELDICIVLYSQLNRSVEGRGGDKRPILSDLKESGSIEEDSDVVEFIYRAEKYGITENDKGESTVGIMEIITEKNRQGGSGTTEVKFLPTISTIIDKSLGSAFISTSNNINDFENQKNIF